MGLLPDLRSDAESGCACEHSRDEGRLLVDAGACDGDGRLSDSPDCLGAVLAALPDDAAADPSTVVTRTDGVDRVYRGWAGALLTAAARFAARVAGHDGRLATKARRQPVAAAREATGRADVTAEVAAETGLAEVAAGVGSLSAVLAPSVGPSVSHWRVETAVPEATLADVQDLPTGATARLYASGDGPELYHLTPLSRDLDASAAALLGAASDRLDAPDGTADTPTEAVRDCAGGADGVATSPAAETVRRVLSKHTTGLGLLEDLFADDRVTDCFVTAPAPENPVRIVVDGATVPTNVRLGERGVHALASRFRRAAGRAFSRAAPTLDATVEIRDRRVRVAGVRPPAAEATAFAIRGHGTESWRLSDLVGNGTLTPGGGGAVSGGRPSGRGRPGRGTSGGRQNHPARGAFVGATRGRPDGHHRGHPGAAGGSVTGRGQRRAGGQDRRRRRRDPAGGGAPNRTPAG